MKQENDNNRPSNEDNEQGSEGESAKGTHLVKKEMTLTMMGILMKVPKTMTLQRMQTMMQRINLKMNTVGQKMRKKTVIEMKMCPTKIKAPLKLKK